MLAGCRGARPTVSDRTTVRRDTLMVPVNVPGIKARLSVPLSFDPATGNIGTGKWEQETGRGKITASVADNRLEVAMVVSDSTVWLPEVTVTATRETVVAAPSDGWTAHLKQLAALVAAILALVAFIRILNMFNK